jgi:RNA polymerase sigma factor for flagellar operon FliA
MQNTGSSSVLEAPCATAADRERLILAYAPTITYVAQRLASRLPPSVALDDLIHAGVIGLIDAIAKYDPTRDNTFKTYAEFRIRGAMLDAVRSLDWAPRSVRQKDRALAQAYATLERTHGRPGRDEEVAALLGIDLEELDAWLMQVRGVSLGSLESSCIGTPDSGSCTLLDLVATDAAQGPEARAQAHQRTALLAEAIEALPQQEKVVIALYYNEELTMKEIGQVLEVTESRVSQIHTKAIFHLRSTLTVLLDA